MTNKNENQSQNQPENKKIDHIEIIESLVNFHTNLQFLNSAFEELFERINSDPESLKKLRDKLKGDRALWPLEDAEKHLHMIIFLAAAFDKVQYIQSEDLLVEVSKVKE